MSRVDEVRERLNKYLEENPNIPAREVSSAVGYSTGAISSFRKGTYQGKAEEVADKVSRVLDVWDEEAKHGYRMRVFETRNFVKTRNTLNRALSYDGIAVIVGDNGVGKTVAAKAYAKQTDSVFIDAHPGYSPKALCIAISRALGLSETRLINEMVDTIVEGAPARLVIIDEAENLPIHTLNMARRIHDMSRLKLALLGSHELRSNLLNRKSTHKYIVGRIGLFETLGNLSLPEIYDILEAYPFKSDAKVREKLVQYSGMNFRTLANLLRLINDYCRKKSSDSIALSDVENARDRVLIVTR